MSFTNELSEGYSHLNFGYVPATLESNHVFEELESQVETLTSAVNNYQHTIYVTDQTVSIGYNTENTNVTIGNGNPGTTTDVKTEFFNAGRYIYLNSTNDYSGATDSGLVMNIEENGPTMTVNSTGFTSNTVNVNQTTGYLPTQIIAVQSTLNTGLYEVLTHLSGVITINTSPNEPFLKSAFNVESANGSVNSVNVQVMRANSDGESEVAYGGFSPLTYNKYLYDTKLTKATGELGKLQLTENADQLQLGNVTVTAADGTERTHTIKSTADDEFTMNDATQTLKNKTMTDNTNNVIARGLWYGSGSNSVSTYSATAPAANQFLKAGSSTTGSWTKVELSAGNSIELNSGKSNANLGAGTITIGVKFDEEQDNPEDTLNDPTPSTNGEFPGVPSPGMGLPGIPGLPGITAAVVGAFAGAIAAGAVAAGAVAAGTVGTGQINDLSGNAVMNLSNGDATFNNNVTINGDLLVNGTTTSVSSNNIALDSRYMYLNSSDNNNTPKSTGLVGTTFPGSTLYNLTNFTAGSGLTPAQSSITPSTGLIAGDIIQVTSNSGSYSGDNKGIYEVLSSSGGTLKVRGYGTNNVEDYTKNNFETDAVNGLDATKVVLSALFDASGRPLYINGDNTSSLIKQPLAYNTSRPSFTSTTTNDLYVDNIYSVSGLNLQVNNSMVFAPATAIQVPLVLTETVSSLSGTNFVNNVIASTGLYVDDIYSVSGSNIQVHNSLVFAPATGIQVPLVLTDTISSLSGTTFVNDVYVPNLDISGTLKVNNIIPHSGSTLSLSGASLSLTGDTLVTGTFNVASSNVSTFGGNLIANTNIYVPNITRTSRQNNARELIYDTTFNRILSRPTTIDNTRKIDDRFQYVTTNWVSVPAIGTIGDPVIDAITGYLSYPSTNDTLGTIISTYPWRIRMNNTSSVYCYSMSQNGMYIYIPSSATARNYFIHRPFAAYKGSGKGGFYFHAKIAFMHLNTTTSTFIGLVSPTGGTNTFSLDGANTLITTQEAIGFLVDYSVNSNYKIRLVVRKSGVTTQYETAVTISTGSMYDFKIQWDYDNSDLIYTYGSNSIVTNSITDFSSNPTNSVLYDPCISVNRSGSTTSGIVVAKMFLECSEDL